jgi:hypothetical protein
MAQGRMWIVLTQSLHSSPDVSIVASEKAHDFNQHLPYYIFSMRHISWQAQQGKEKQVGGAVYYFGVGRKMSRHQ